MLLRRQPACSCCLRERRRVRFSRPVAAGVRLRKPLHGDTRAHGRRRLLGITPETPVWTANTQLCGSRVFGRAMTQNRACCARQRAAAMLTCARAEAIWDCLTLAPKYARGGTACIAMWRIAVQFMFTRVLQIELIFNPHLGAIKSRSPGAPCNQFVASRPLLRSWALSRAIIPHSENSN